METEEEPAMPELDLAPGEALYYEYNAATRHMQTFIFVNALTGNTGMWSGSICETLQTAGYGTLVYNFRGQEHTTFGDATALTPSVIVSDLCALIHHVKPPSPILVGLSIGGLFAAQACLAGADTTGLVFINTLRKPTQRLNWINRAMVDLARVGGGRMVMTANIPVIASPDLIANLWDATFVEQPFEAPDPTDGLFRLMEGSLATEWDFPYEKLAHPVLILTGEHDRLFRIDADVNELKGRIPDAEEKRYSDAGHLIPLEDPDGFTDDLLGFARRCAAVG